MIRTFEKSWDPGPKHHQIRSWVRIPLRFGDKAALLQNGGDVTEERGELEEVITVTARVKASASIHDRVHTGK